MLWKAGTLKAFPAIPATESALRLLPGRAVSSVQFIRQCSDILAEVPDVIETLTAGGFFLKTPELPGFR